MNEAPTAAPSKASSRESSRQETSELTGSGTTPGRNCETKSLTGTNRLNMSPMASPGSVNLLGSSLVPASVKIRPSSRYPKTQYFNAARVRPKCQKQPRNNAPVRSEEHTSELQ